MFIATHPKTMSSPYLTGSLSSGKTPSWGCELEPRGGEGWLLLQDGRSSRDGGGHSASELPSKTMPTGHNWGSLLGRGERESESHLTISTLDCQKDFLVKLIEYFHKSSLDSTP